MRSLMGAAAALAVIICVSPSLRADPHLEVGFAASPVIIQDGGFEAFSEDLLRADRFGVDVRVEVATFWKNVHLLPLVGYRFALNEGRVYDMMDTRLATNDFFAGLRLRGWFQPWLGVFVQATGGVSLLRMGAEIDDVSGVGARSEYEDDAVTWSAEGLLGLELRLSPAMLTRRGVERFNFGGELSFGYVRKGAVGFEPDPTGGDDYSLPVEGTADWGELNTSGWVIQVGLTFSFF